MKKHILRFRAANQDIFEAIVAGKKKVETRAATERYRGITSGDLIVLVCGKKKEEKIVKVSKVFQSISALVKKYKPKQINPQLGTVKEIQDMYYSFPGYKDKIKKFGIIALELK